jgi:hypothetical protein
MPLSDNIYTVQWNKFTLWLIPPILRNNKIVAMATALTTSVNDLYVRFWQFRKSIQYRISINYQTCYLQKLLNDQYDFTLRRIKILNTFLNSPATSLYQNTEGVPVKLYQKSEGNPLILYQRSETAENNISFIIQIPAALYSTIDLTGLTALVQCYCLPTKTFIIQPI